MFPSGNAGGSCRVRSPQPVRKFLTPLNAHLHPRVSGSRRRPPRKMPRRLSILTLPLVYITLRFKARPRLTASRPPQPPRIRHLTLAPSQAPGGDGHRPGGSFGDDRRVVYAKWIRSDFNSSGRLRQGGFQPAANEWLPPRGFLPPGSPLPVQPRWAPWDPSAGCSPRPRSGGRVGACAGSWDARALADGLAAGLAADRVSDSVDELAWAMQAQLAMLAGSPAFPVWSRPDPTFKPLLSGFLASPQGTRRVTVLFDTGATHCFICARLAATMCLPPSTHPGPTFVTTAAPGGTQDLPAPELAHLGLCDTLQVSPMEMDVGDDLDPGLGLDLEPRSTPPLRGLPRQSPVGVYTASDAPPARRGPPRAAHGVGYRPRGVSPASARSSGPLRSIVSRLNLLSRAPLLRPRRRRHVARRDGPASSTPITPTLLPSKARNGRRAALALGASARRAHQAQSLSACSRQG